MYIFQMSAETALTFYERCDEREAHTEEQRVKIITEMVEEGYNISISKTNRTKDQYVKDLAKEFKVMSIDQENSNAELN